METMGVGMFEYLPWGGGSALSWFSIDAFTIITFQRFIGEEKTPYGPDAIGLFLSIPLLSANQIAELKSIDDENTRWLMKHL